MRKRILAVAVLVAMMMAGCGTEKTIVQGQAENNPSIELLSPNGGEVLVEGSMLIVKWDIKTGESFDYNESYDLHWFLIPQDSTPVNIGQGIFFDQRAGGYDLGGWSPVPYINEGSVYVTVPVDIPEGAYRLKIYLNEHNNYAYPDFSNVLSVDESDEIFTVKIDPAVFATDSDRSINYSWAGTIYEITPQNYPDFFTAGVGRGIYKGSSTNLIFGQEPNPEIPKSTSDNFSTFYDYCASPTQLNEAYVTIDGQLSAIGVQCPKGCQNGACIP